MDQKDVLSVGKLVLASVVVGGVLVSGGPAVTKLLLEAVVAWLGR